MKKLIEMSQLVTDFIDASTLKHLFKQDSNDPKAYRLLEGIINKKYNDDKEAAKDLYNSSPDNKSYLMLKSRTKERMLNLIFTMDNNRRMKSSYQKALFSTSRNLVAARLLILRGMRNVAVDFLKSAALTSEKFQFTDFELSAARQLRLHETFAGTEKKMKKHDAIIKSKTELLNAEIEMEYLMGKIFVQIRKTAAPKEKLRLISAESFNSAKKIFKKHRSHSLIVNYYRIAIFFNHSHGYHNEVIKSCNECEKYLKNHSVFTDHAFLSELALQKLDTSLYLKDYTLGKESAAVCRSYFNPGYINWLIFLEYYFLLCLHSQNYYEAQKVFNEVITHPKFSTYPPERLEKWKIFEAYLFYILPENAKQKNFNVFRFINEVPIFSKDKRGYNLSIIIAQIALLIKMGDFEKVMDKFNSLKSYSGRYVSKTRNPRSFYFVKMLLLMVKYDFDPQKTNSIANKFFVKLRQSTIGNQGELETLEVIPYDILWEDLIAKLEEIHRKAQEVLKT
jgi:hypothetical protein